MTSSRRRSDLVSQGLAVLQWLAVRQTSEVILERVLPLLTSRLSSPVAAVRVAAVHSLVTSLGAVTSVPRRDSNTFPEYVLPALLPLCQVSSAFSRHSSPCPRTPAWR